LLRHHRLQSEVSYQLTENVRRSRESPDIFFNAKLVLRYFFYGIPFFDRLLVAQKLQPGGHALPKFLLAYLVILCFEKRLSKQKCCCARKVKHFGYLENFGLATPPAASTMFIL